jgi:hypothetical protein
MAIVHSFHTGRPLNLWEKCCLSSFVDHGHDTVLFSYDELEVPPGVRLLPAQEIVSERERASFFAVAPNQFGQFSDLFRYELLRRAGGWWVDTDVLCLSPVLPDEEVVIGRKKPVKGLGPFRINGAVMRFPAGHPLLEEASQFVRSNLHLLTSSSRSVMGPVLLTRLVPQYGIQPRKRSFFDPVRIWDLLDPTKRNDVELAVSASCMIHLYQQIFKVANLSRDVLPPKDSFLADAFTKHGGAGRINLRLEDLRRIRGQASPSLGLRLRSALKRMVRWLQPWRGSNQPNRRTCRRRDCPTRRGM